MTATVVMAPQDVTIITMLALAHIMITATRTIYGRLLLTVATIIVGTCLRVTLVQKVVIPDTPMRLAVFLRAALQNIHPSPAAEAAPLLTLKTIKSPTT